MLALVVENLIVQLSDTNADDGKQLSTAWRRTVSFSGTDKRPAQPENEEHIENDQQTDDNDADRDDGHFRVRRRGPPAPTCTSIVTCNVVTCIDVKKRSYVFKKNIVTFVRLWRLCVYY